MFRLLTDKFGRLPWQGSAGDASEPSFLIVTCLGARGPGPGQIRVTASTHTPKETLERDAVLRATEYKRSQSTKAAGPIFDTRLRRADPLHSIYPPLAELYTNA